jgi:hypothetical protein
VRAGDLLEKQIMRKYIIFIVALLLCGSASAQEKNREVLLKFIEGLEQCIVALETNTVLSA